MIFTPFDARLIDRSEKTEKIKPSPVYIQGPSCNPGNLMSFKWHDICDTLSTANNVSYGCCQRIHCWPCIPDVPILVNGSYGHLLFTFLYTFRSLLVASDCPVAWSTQYVRELLFSYINFMACDVGEWDSEFVAGLWTANRLPASPLPTPAMSFWKLLLQENLAIHRLQQFVIPHFHIFVSNCLMLENKAAFRFPLFIRVFERFRALCFLH